MQLLAHGLSGAFRCNARFDPVRRWSVDFLFERVKLAVELEGGNFVQGRHVRGRGFEKDCEKYNALVLAGYRLLRFTGDMVREGKAWPTICAYLQQRGLLWKDPIAERRRATLREKEL